MPLPEKKDSLTLSLLDLAVQLLSCTTLGICVANAGWLDTISSKQRLKHRLPLYASKENGRLLIPPQPRPMWPGPGPGPPKDPQLPRPSYSYRQMLPAPAPAAQPLAQPQLPRPSYGYRMLPAPAPETQPLTQPQLPRSCRQMPLPLLLMLPVTKGLRRAPDSSQQAKLVHVHGHHHLMKADEANAMP